jgi:hypothetical protein
MHDGENVRAEGEGRVNLLDNAAICYKHDKERGRERGRMHDVTQSHDVTHVGQRSFFSANVPGQSNNA